MSITHRLRAVRPLVRLLVDELSRLPDEYPDDDPMAQPVASAHR